MLVRVGWKKSVVEHEVPFIPMSGFVGDNLVQESLNMPWWKGCDVRVFGDKKKVVHVHTLYDALDQMVQVGARAVANFSLRISEHDLSLTQTPIRKGDAALRVPLAGVYNIIGVGTVLTGRIEQVR